MPRLCLVLAMFTAACAVAPGPRRVRVAMCQVEVTADAAANLAAVERAVSSAAEAGAHVAVFPEACVFGWVNGAAHAGAAPIPGATTERLSRCARAHGVAIVLGLAERDGDRLRNTVVLIDTDGALLAKHRKVNVLTELMDPPYAPGEHARDSVVEASFGRVGLLICADTFRDDLVDEVAAARPDLVLVPYGWAAPADAWPGHGESLTAWVRRTAQRCGCPVVGVDAVGQIHDGPWRGQVLGGQSPAVGADGEVLAVLADRAPDLRVVDVSLR